MPCPTMPLGAAAADTFWRVIGRMFENMICRLWFCRLACWLARLEEMLKVFGWHMRTLALLFCQSSGRLLRDR